MAARTFPRLQALRCSHSIRLPSPTTSKPSPSNSRPITHAHAYSTTTTTLPSTLRISSTSNSTTISRTLPSLLPPLGHWHLTPTSSPFALERTFTFRTFKAAWSFMTHVAAYASKTRHHPEWSNIYNRVFVRWTTHSPPGLSEKDVEGARKCEEFAVLVKGESGDVTGDGGDVRGLVEDVRRGGKEGEGKVGEGEERLEEKRRIEREEGEEGKEGSVAGIGGQPT